MNWIKSVRLWQSVSAILFVLCLVLAYRVLDLGVTLTYGQEGMQTLEEKNLLLMKLAETGLAGTSKSEIQKLLKEYKVNAVGNPSDPDILYFLNFAFIFKSGKLISIENNK